MIKNAHSISPCCEVRETGLNGVHWYGWADQNLLNKIGVADLSIRLDEAINKGVFLKDGSKSLVSHVNLAGTEVVIKGYRHLGWFHSLRHTLKGSRARSAWVMANRLCQLKVPTPKPLAYIDEYKGAILWRSYFLYEYVSGPPLSAMMRDPSVSDGQKQRLIDEVVAILGHLSEQGISHGDMKLTNMICHDDQVMFIDLDAMRPVLGPDFFKRWRYEKDKARFLRDMSDG